jgi:hypothetical protein
VIAHQRTASIASRDWTGILSGEKARLAIDAAQDNVQRAAGVVGEKSKGRRG